MDAERWRSDLHAQLYAAISMHNNISEEMRTAGLVYIRERALAHRRVHKGAYLHSHENFGDVDDIIMSLLCKLYATRPVLKPGTRAMLEMIKSIIPQC